MLSQHQMKNITNKGTTMKVSDFYKAEKLIKQHEKLKRIADGFKNNRTNVSIPLSSLEPDTIKKIEAFFMKLQKDTETELEKI